MLNKYEFHFDKLELFGPQYDPHPPTIWLQGVNKYTIPQWLYFKTCAYLLFLFPTHDEAYLVFRICCAFLRNVSSSHDLPHLIFRTIWEASSAFPSHPLYFVFVAVFSSYQATSHQMKLISYSGQCKLLHLRCLAPFVGGFASNLMGLIWGGEKNTWILENAQAWYYQLSVLIIICI